MVSLLIIAVCLLVGLDALSLEPEVGSETLRCAHHVMEEYFVGDIVVHADAFWLSRLSGFLASLHSEISSPVTVARAGQVLEVSRSTVVFLQDVSTLGKLFPVTSQRLHVLVVVRRCASGAPEVFVATVLLLCRGEIRAWFGVPSPLPLGRWVPAPGGRLEPRVPLYPEVTDLRGREVVAAVYLWPMRVMHVDPSSLAAVAGGGAVNAGLEVQLLELLAAWSNATLRYVRHAAEEWSEVNAGVAGGLYDVGAATFILDLTAVPGINTTDTYDTSHYRWYVPAGGKLSPVEGLVRIFSVDTWAALLSAYVVYSLCYWMVGRRRLDVVVSFMTTERALLGSSVTPLPSAPMPRLVLFLWLVFGVVFSSLGQSSLFGALVRPGRQRPVQSVEEILTTGLPIRCTMSSLMFLTTFSLDKYDEVVRRATTCVLEDCVRRLLSHRDSVFCDSDAIMDLLVPREFTSASSSSSGKAVLSTLQTDSYDLMHTMVMRRGFVLGHRLNTLIRRATEGGLIVKWRGDLLVSQSIVRGEGVLATEDGYRRSFSLEQTVGGFIVLAIGLLVATLVFLLQYSRFCRTPRRNRNIRRAGRGLY